VVVPHLVLISMDTLLSQQREDRNVNVSAARQGQDMGLLVHLDDLSQGLQLTKRCLGFTPVPVHTQQTAGRRALAHECSEPV
jgi:hypothetical protein